MIGNSLNSKQFDDWKITFCMQIGNIFIQILRESASV